MMANRVLEVGLTRLVGHITHNPLSKQELRRSARFFEELAGLARRNAELARLWALEPRCPGKARLRSWVERLRLLQRAAVLDEVAAGLRCELALRRRAA